MNVAIYARVSTLDQKCDRQIRDLQAFAERAGHSVIQTFTEISSGARNDRKERARVLELARQKKIDAILVTELTRWGRSTTDLLSTLQSLAAWEVSVIAQTGFDFNLSTPQGKFMVTLMAGMSEFERDILRERVKSGLAARKARGNHVGRKPGHNWKTSKSENEVKKLLNAGASCRQIAKELKLSVGSVINVKKRITDVTSKTPA